MSSRICLAVKLAALGWTVRPLTDAREMGCPRRKTAGSTAGVMSSPEVGQYERTSLDRAPDDISSGTYLPNVASVTADEG